MLPALDVGQVAEPSVFWRHVSCAHADVAVAQLPSTWHRRVATPEKPGTHAPVATAPDSVSAQSALAESESGGHVSCVHGFTMVVKAPVMSQLRVGEPLHPAMHAPMTLSVPALDVGHVAESSVVARHVMATHVTVPVPHAPSLLHRRVAAPLKPALHAPVAWLPAAVAGNAALR